MELDYLFLEKTFLLVLTAVPTTLKLNNIESTAFLDRVNHSRSN